MLIRYLTIALLSVSLAGCGFHLRGSGPSTLDISSVYVDAGSARKLGEEVSTQLSSMGVALPASAEEAEYTLKLTNEREDRKLLTVSADTGKVEEYELIYAATMSVIGQDGKVLSEDQDVSARRDLTFDEGAVVGKFEEERTMQEDLRRRVAANVLRRLSAVTR